MIGYRTRLATVVTWLLLASLQARNPMLLYERDHLLRLAALLVDLPAARLLLVRRSSLAWAAPRTARMRHCSAASAAILLQMSSMYFFSGLLKQNQDWQSGEALSHVLLRYVRQAVGRVTRQYP